MIKNNIRKKGFTLIEILLIVFFIGLTFLGVYMMQGKTSDEVTISKEKEYILTLFDEIDRSASVLSRFQNISLQSLKDNGYIAKTNGFELVSVNAPIPTRLEATYNNLKNKECSMFVSSIVNFSETYSAKINNIIIPSKADPKNITLECSNDLNEVVIVRENNVFGVALNTSLNGINNPIIGQNINSCPVGGCNTMTPVTPVPFTPITVTMNKPTVTIPAAVTTPTFTPGTPMVQPPVVPPVVTPPAGPSDPYQNYPKTLNIICGMYCNRDDSIDYRNFEPQINEIITNYNSYYYSSNPTPEILAPDNMIPNITAQKIVGNSTGGTIYNYDFAQLRSLRYKFYIYRYINGNNNSYVGRGFSIYLCKNNSCPWPVPND